MDWRSAIGHSPTPAVRRILYSVTFGGLAASLFGFVMAYKWLPRSGEMLVGYILVSLGVIAAMYGFLQAYRGIKEWRIASVTPWVAFLIITAGMISSGYGLRWAFKGLGTVSDPTTQVASMVFVGMGALAALIGFVIAYRTVWKQKRGDNQRGIGAST